MLRRRSRLFGFKVLVFSFVVTVFLIGRPSIDQNQPRQHDLTRIERSDSYGLFFNFKKDLETTPRDGSRTKKILFWTRDNENGRDHVVGLGKDGFRQAGCPVWQCEVFDTEMENLPALTDFEAVVFFEPSWESRDRPLRRSPHQRYVYWTLESPGWAPHVHYKEWTNLSGFFNWTMTYRWDSDVVHPYGWINPAHPSKTLRAKRNYAEGKTRMAAWIVSNCKASNGRNEYVQRLQQFIDVDVYGKCGPLRCPDDCRRLVEKKYKFYLAFENSLCEDYVTEKFFISMAYDVIPVVFDLHGNHRQAAPVKSYINALDFPSVRHLADYLMELDRNDTLYNEYFWWKDHFEVHHGSTGSDDFKRGFCRLCSLLHDPKAIKPKVYDDLTGWWAGKSQCKVIRFNNQSTNAVHHFWSVQPIQIH